MIRPTGNHFTIVEYRDFYDIPRRILAKDQGGAFWILDSIFDDEVDDYQDHFTLFFASQELVQAQRLFSEHCEGRFGLPSFDLPVSRLLFDPTKRASFALS